MSTGFREPCVLGDQACFIFRFQTRCFGVCSKEHCCHYSRWNRNLSACRTKGAKEPKESVNSKNVFQNPVFESAFDGLHDASLAKITLSSSTQTVDVECLNDQRETSLTARPQTSQAQKSSFWCVFRALRAADSTYVVYATACVYREMYGKITKKGRQRLRITSLNGVGMTQVSDTFEVGKLYFKIDSYLPDFRKSVIFPYISLYTQAVAYTTHVESAARRALKNTSKRRLLSLGSLCLHLEINYCNLRPGYKDTLKPI